MLCSQTKGPPTTGIALMWIDHNFYSVCMYNVSRLTDGEKLESCSKKRKKSNKNLREIAANNFEIPTLKCVGGISVNFAHQILRCTINHNHMTPLRTVPLFILVLLLMLKTK